MASQVALEAPEGFHALLPSASLRSSMPCGRVKTSTCDGDDVESSVQASVAVAVTAVPLVFAGGRRDRCYAGHPRKVRVSGEPLGAGRTLRR